MEYNTTSKETWNSVNESYPRESPEIDSIEISLSIIIGIVCTFGLAGNGTVIRLLGFRIKRNPFTTYILNLAVADFGLLITVALLILQPILPTHILWIIWDIFYDLFLVFYSIGQLLLTAISVDRCVSVLFPIWYRCHRPPQFSTLVCVLIWVLSSVFNGIPTILYLFGNNDFYSLSYQLIVNAVLCLPLITISTLILFIRVCFKSRQHRRGRILIIVLLTLFFYIFFDFPFNVAFIIIEPLYSHRFRYFRNCLYLTTSLNSSVNPFIYFLVGRKKRSHSREGVKVILQRVFKEEEVPVAEEEPPLETLL